MKYFRYVLITLIIPILFIIICLISIFDSPEYEIFIPLGILSIICLLILLFNLFLKVVTNKTFQPSLIIISNFLFISVSIVPIKYMYFYDLVTYHISNHPRFDDEALHFIAFSIILTSIIINLIFLSKIISPKRKGEYSILIFIPIVSLQFLKFNSFFNSKEVIWIKNGENEDRVNHKEFLNLDLDDNTPIWYKGLDEWITYRDFKLRTPLSMIK